MEAATPKGRLFNEVLVEVFRLRARLLESAESIAALAGLTSARWQILGALEHGPAPVAQIARNLGLTRQTVQEAVDAMTVARLEAAASRKARSNVALHFRRCPEHRR